MSATVYRVLYDSSHQLIAPVREAFFSELEEAVAPDVGGVFSGNRLEAHWRCEDWATVGDDPSAPLGELFGMIPTSLFAIAAQHIECFREAFGAFGELLPASLTGARGDLAVFNTLEAKAAVCSERSRLKGMPHQRQLVFRRSQLEPGCIFRDLHFPSSVYTYDDGNCGLRTWCQRFALSGLEFSAELSY